MIIRDDRAVSVREMQDGLERLERREWWRWGVALLIMLLLTFGVFAVSLPGLRKDILSDFQFESVVPGLFAMVLVFDFFAIYQQIQISRLRRQLSAQIGMMGALEALKPTSKEPGSQQKDRRRSPRHSYDQRLRVKATVKGKETVYLGRVIDISELGIAAVLPASLERGDQVIVEFRGAEDDSVLILPAIVRYANGFRHGCEFAGLTDLEMAKVRRACEFAETTLLAMKA
ncbi:MAG TPA: PilZ domain-containing protein [Candidatus Angelobacter sp.]|nr:PilZ domain-containing protein [Candidatus Angelobacter sp.]